MSRKGRTAAKARAARRRADAAARSTSTPPPALDRAPAGPAQPSLAPWVPPTLNWTEPVPAPDPCNGLRGLVDAARAAGAAVDAEVARLHDAGVGWPAIAAALGITRQGARQRYLRVSG